MLLNLTNDIRNFSKLEITKLDSFLLKLQIKGELDGIILEIFNDKEGLVEFGENKIRLSLPDGVKKGDKVTIKADRSNSVLTFQISKKVKSAISKAVTGKAVEKSASSVAKENVYHIRIPQKVSFSDVIIEIKANVMNLNRSAYEDIAGSIERFIDAETVKMNDAVSTKELAVEIEKYVKKSGIFFESKLRDLTFEIEPHKRGNAIDATGIKDDIKYKINSILGELKGVNIKITKNVQGLRALDELAKLFTNLEENFEELPPQKSVISREIQISVANSIQNISFDFSGLEIEPVIKVINFLATMTNFMNDTGILNEDVLIKLAEIADEIETAFPKATLNNPAADAEEPLLQTTKELGVKLADFKEKLIIAKEFLINKSGSAHVDTKTIKAGLNKLISNIAELKEDFQEVTIRAGNRDIKTIDSLIRSFSRLLEGIEYQQFSNLKGPDGNLNYFLVPVAFDDTVETPEIVISHRSSDKDRGKKGTGGSRIEVYLDLSYAGHIKADFNVTGKDIAGNFFSSDEETVQMIESELPLLQESLAQRGFNVAWVGSKRIMKIEKCEICPDDRLMLEEINIFDFKV